MTGTPATVVFVHGAYHGPWVWDAVRAELADLPTAAVLLPSCGTDTTALGSLADDAAALNDLLAGIPADAEAPTVVVAHSYGGAVASQALRDGAPVSRIVFVAAFVPDVGEAVSDLGQRRRTNHTRSAHSRPGPSKGYVDPPRDRAAELFFDDLDPEHARWARERLVATSIASQTTPLTHAGWREIPSSYVVCTRDGILAPATQEELAERTQTVHRLASSHSPMLSRPAELAALIRRELPSPTHPTGAPS